jgi:hypothetical protein
LLKRAFSSTSKVILRPQNQQGSIEKSTMVVNHVKHYF